MCFKVLGKRGESDELAIRVAGRGRFGIGRVGSGLIKVVGSSRGVGGGSVWWKSVQWCGSSSGV